MIRRLNVERLSAVKEKVLTNPVAFSMDYWHAWFDDWATYSSSVLVEETEAPPCNTVCCISGWAVLLANPDMQKARTPLTEAAATGMQLLGLENEELFFTCDWPNSYYERYTDVDSTAQSRAQVAADLIEALIEAGSWSALMHKEGP